VADATLLARVSGLDGDSVADALRSAVDHAILVAEPDGGGYRFRHALLEEAVHDDLLPADRVELHRRVAAALLDATTRGGQAAPPGELARHLDLGGQTALAVAAHLDAADAAFRALAWTEGVAAYSRAAELAATARPGEIDEAVLERLREIVIPTALAMNWSGSPGRAIALLRSASAQAEATGDLHTAASLLVTLSRILNDGG
jgi:hypothetical protein